VQMRGEGRGEGGVSTGVSALVHVKALLYVCEADSGFGITWMEALSEGSGINY
jgi:hypothetical protein